MDCSDETSSGGGLLGLGFGVAKKLFEAWEEQSSP